MTLSDKNNVLVIRADSSAKIGTGHIMRCLSLSEIIKPLFSRIVFICRDLPGNVSNRVLEQGYHLELIEGTKDISHDADMVRGVLSQFDGIDLLIVDHYGLDSGWEQHISSCVNKLMVIDDLNREHVCDILLDQNVLGDRVNSYEDKLPSHCLKLLGPKYALLRLLFSKMKPTSLKKIEKVNRIFLFMSGADDGGSTFRLLSILSELLQEGCDFEVKVICGDVNKQFEKIKALCEKVSAFCMEKFTPHIAAMMLDSDICIGAGSSTTWERCCLGKASMVVVFADNHKQIAEDGVTFGFHASCGDIRTISDHEIKTQLSSYLADIDSINEQSQKAWQLVDGRGALRVRDSIAKACGF